MVALGCMLVLAFWVSVGFILSVLWNAVAVPLFGAPTIDTWMALGLMLLVGFLTGGINPRVRM